MGQGGSAHRGVGKALAEERMRAELAVKLHMAIGASDKATHRAVLEDAFKASDADGDGTIDFEEFCSTAAAIGIGVSEAELRSLSFDPTDRFEALVFSG